VRILVLVIFLSLIYGVQRFWFLRAWRAAEQLSSPALRHGLEVFLIAALLAFVVSLFSPVVSRFIPVRLIPQSVITVSRLWLIASLFGFIAFQSVGALEWISNLAMRFRPSDGIAFSPARREFFRYAAYFAGSLPFLATTYGFAAGRLRYRVEKVDVPIHNLPPGLDGLRIAQLSDIHIGSYMPPREIARAVEMANDLQPDLAVITGDFVSDHNDPLDVCIGELSKLKAPLGVFGCNGNHEIYASAEEAAQSLFQQHGMRLLRQESVEIAHRGDKFNLIGVDYQRDHMVAGGSTGPMLSGIEHLVRPDLPNVLLSHNPNSFHRAAELGIDLSLAGHTHGGQVQVEIVDRRISPARLITDFVAGLYHLPMGNGAGRNGNSASENGNGSGKASLYVNRGLGTFGMPVRIGVPPEITLLTLRRA
jgi:predicted MPP superfamily phosphohydrolase